MMDYEVFKNVVATRIKDFLPSVYAEFEVSIDSVPKINGMREALRLSFRAEGCFITGPNIYMDDLYDDFKRQGDLEDVLGHAATVILGCTGTQAFSRDGHLESEDYKEYIVQMLINTDMNKELLESAPHREYFDLSLIYRLAIPEPDGKGFLTALITYELMESMGLNAGELDALAEKNSRRMLKTEVYCSGPILTMITTEAKMYGAINLLRLDEIRKLSESLGGNLYLLPSSVHDLVIIKEDSSHTEEGLFELLKSGNCKCNPLDQNLSYNIYYYDYAADKLIMKTRDGAAKLK